MKLDAPGLANELVRLDVFEERHAWDLEAARASDAIWKSMPDIRKGGSLPAYAEHALEQKRSGAMRPFAIFRQHDEAFAGVVAYENIHRVHRRLRIAHYWHPEPLRGVGIFLASQALLIERALDWGARRVSWRVSSRDRAALAAVRSLGAREEGRLRSYTRFADGTFSDLVVLSLLRDEAKVALPLINDHWRAKMAASSAQSTDA